jgi:hypothetical protein
VPVCVRFVVVDFRAIHPVRGGVFFLVGAVRKGAPKNRKRFSFSSLSPRQSVPFPCPHTPPSPLNYRASWGPDSAALQGQGGIEAANLTYPTATKIAILGQDQPQRNPGIISNKSRSVKETRAGFGALAMIRYYAHWGTSFTRLTYNIRHLFVPNGSCEK